MEGKKPREPVVTKTGAAPDSNFAFQLDKTCSDLISAILENQYTHQEGALIPLPGCSKQFKIFKTFSPLELKLLKKEFINLTKLHPPQNNKEIGDLFITYISSTEDKD